MTAKSKKILDAALKLSDKERFAIAARLLEGLSVEEVEAFANTWEEELDRRLIEDGPGIPWEVVKHLR